MPIEKAARRLFRELVFADCDYALAVQLRKEFVERHAFCMRCGEIKLREKFTRIGNIIEFPCIACRRVYYEKKREAMREAKHEEAQCVE
jgi:hypothetical protein